MSEKDIIEKQEQTGNQAFYLIQQGIFFNAYGSGAYALSRATGYKVKAKPRKHGSVAQCGFNMDTLDKVCRRIRDAGGEIEEIDRKTYLFRGFDGTPDETMVSPPLEKSVKSVMAKNDIISALLSFNLSISTPMDAMNLIAALQQRLKE